MKKKLLLIACCVTTLCSIKAQSFSGANSQNEELFNNYLIRVFVTSTKGYCYDVLFKNNIVIHQVNNPFTNAPAGLNSKADAFKAAKWQIIHLSLPSSSYNRFQNPNQCIPIQVAKQLKIAIQ
jgi:hypothetical protein